MKEAGKRHCKGSCQDLPIPHAKRRRVVQLLEDSSEEGQCDWQLGDCWSETVCALDASDSVLQLSLGEPVKLQAEVDMPGSESIKLMFDAMVWVGASHVTDPLGEEEIASWERDSSGTEMTLDKGLEPVRDAGASATAGFSQASPDVCGCGG